jgi:hypothetical protein
LPNYDIDRYAEGFLEFHFYARTLKRAEFAFALYVQVDITTATGVIHT